MQNVDNTRITKLDCKRQSPAASIAKRRYKPKAQTRSIEVPSFKAVLKKNHLKANTHQGVKAKLPKEHQAIKQRTEHQQSDANNTVEGIQDKVLNDTEKTKLDIVSNKTTQEQLSDDKKTVAPEVVASGDEQPTVLDYQQMTTVNMEVLTLLEQLSAILNGHEVTSKDGELLTLDIIATEIKALHVKQMLMSLTQEKGDISKSFDLPEEQLKVLKDTLSQLTLDAKGQSQVIKPSDLEALNGVLNSLEAQITSITSQSKASLTQAQEAETTATKILDIQAETAKPIAKKIIDQQVKDNLKEEHSSGQLSLKKDDSVIVKRESSDKVFFSEFSAEVKGAENTVKGVEVANQKLDSIRLMTRENIFEQVKTAIVKQSIKAGDHSEMVIKLKPEELGKVELKIEVHNENVIAKFNVASQMVKEAIESNLSDLRSSLKDKGFSDMSFNVNVGKDGQQKREGSRQNNASRRRVVYQIDAEQGSSNYVKTLAGIVSETTFEHLA